MNKQLSFLALGDSYTIGEGVALADSFPYQLAGRFRQRGLPVLAPEIIARTGWTTDELATAIAGTDLLPTYDLVTLLIGVNNQYRGRSTENYASEFRGLLARALALGAGRPEAVMVISIPDWGVTPFARDRDPGLIAREIDRFNDINRHYALESKTGYADICPLTRQTMLSPEGLTTDGLHPSPAEYSRWVALITEQWKK